MAATNEALDELATALMAFDFSSAFPSAYTGTKAVMLVDSWPFDLIDNMLTESDGRMTQPVISLILADDTDKPRSFGDNQFGGGTGTKAMGVDMSFVASCWADEGMGGGPTVNKLVGLVQGCVFANRNTLTGLRQLTASRGHLAYEERPQVWRADLSIAGHGLNSY